MSELIRIENISKYYRIGVINRGMLYKDLQSWWAHWRGKEDPNRAIIENAQSPSGDRLKNGEDFWALRDVSLSVNAGDAIGIVGKNGAGKSTLLKILSRTTAPSKGRVLTRGRISSLLEVGTGFHPELTGRENVFLNGAILGMSKREVRSKFDEIVEFAEIGEFIDTPVKRYSSGMYVRLAFAVAAHLDPEVLIVDEVLAVGDANFQRKCIGKMGKVCKEGRTVIVVSHSMIMVESLTTKCLWLHDGQMKQYGDSALVATEYLKFSQMQQLGTTEGLHDYKLRRGLGNVRLDDFRTLDSTGQYQNRFHRGEKIIFKVAVKVFADTRDLAIVISFKLGLSGEHLVMTPRIVLSKTSLAKGGHIEAEIEINSAQIPAALYDLYIWLGPIVEEFVDEYHDIADGVVAPIEILEKSSSSIKQYTEIEATILKIASIA